jgi:hypothetical protein
MAARVEMPRQLANERLFSPADIQGMIGDENTHDVGPKPMGVFPGTVTMEDEKRLSIHESSPPELPGRSSAV